MTATAGHKPYAAAEKQAWARLHTLNPDDVCRRSLAGYDSCSGAYTLYCFGQKISILTGDELLVADTADGKKLISGEGISYTLPVLWYLARAQEAPLSGRLIPPVQTNGGIIYTRGTHVLPLQKICACYSLALPDFIRRGLEIDGEVLNHGDASIRIHAFPRVPIVITLWKSDEEFPARCDLLLDAGCRLHLPPDVIWATAVIAIKMMLNQEEPLPVQKSDY